MANRNTSSKRSMWQTKRCSKDEAAALRKNHVSRPGRLGATSHYWIERLNTATTCLEPPFTFEMSNTLTSSHRSVPNVLSLRFIASVSKLVPENIPKSVSKHSVRYSHCILLNSKVWLGRSTVGFYDTALNEANDAELPRIVPTPARVTKQGRCARSWL